MNNTNDSSPTILLVDDEQAILTSYRISLTSRGYDSIICCSDSREVMPLLKRHNVDVILLDLVIPFLSGEELLPMIVESYPDIPVVISTGVDDVDTAVRCLKLGARDYMVKPVERNRFLSGIQRLLELKNLRQENESLKRGLLGESLQYSEAFNGIITQNKTMMSLFMYMEAVADSGEPLLITGETGVGKELIAQAMHKLAPGDGKFVSVNVAGLDDNMFSDTLFGHQKGAFTDAHQHRSGLVEEASKGTLFLDEIGDLNLQSQVKLLRLLQEKEYYPLGSDRVKRAYCRVICCTNKKLENLTEKNEFRKDLYYRLCTHSIHIPPLRQRMDDLPLLIDFFNEEAAASTGKIKITPTPEAIQYLNRYDFPGNVRELRAVIFNAVSTGNPDIMKSSSRITANVNESGEFPPNIKQEYSISSSNDTIQRITQFLSQYSSLPTLEEFETAIIHEAMSRTNGNASEAARMLGIHRQTIAKRLKTT
jgi:DNA-binding NtrC family response regulator